jgi:hypothetical protein
MDSNQQAVADDRSSFVELKRQSGDRQRLDRDALPALFSSS